MTLPQVQRLVAGGDEERQTAPGLERKVACADAKGGGHMPIKLSGRYEEGSDKNRAHALLLKCEIKVDSVFGVEQLKPGMEAITFTIDGQAQTAFAADDDIFRVIDGWDIPPPADREVWRGTQ
jgi:hypothetical protein